VDLPPPPPECPRGWQTGPPDFVGVAAQRSGTTRWCNLILAHPEVVRTHAKKELHYFDRFYAGGFTAATASGYHAYFPSDGRKTGEWTPMYASAPWIPALLAAAAPAARLLMLLRDPVERYLSGLELDIETARKRGAPLSRYAPLEAFSRGFYHAQLQGRGRNRTSGEAPSRAPLVIEQREDRRLLEQIRDHREHALGAARDEQVVVHERHTGGGAIDLAHLVLAPSAR